MTIHKLTTEVKLSSLVAVNQTSPVRYLERVEAKHGRISRCGLFTHLLDEFTLTHSNSRNRRASTRNFPLNDVMSYTPVLGSLINNLLFINLHVQS